MRLRFPMPARHARAVPLLAASALVIPVLAGLAPTLFTGGTATAQSAAKPQAEPRSPEGKRYLSQPLVTSIYTADPSAHVFNGKIYVYPSHDIDVTTADDDLGNQYAMRDYRVLSMDRIGGPVKVNPVATCSTAAFSSTSSRSFSERTAIAIFGLLPRRVSKSART